MFKDLYKKSCDLSELQKERRVQLLKEQREKRLELHDKTRETRDSSSASNKAKDSGHYRRKHKTFKELYQSDIQLQMSEWMRDKPDDLYDWFLVPCPKGQRCMVVACKERTRMFNKYGRKCFTFKSLLPGSGVNKKSFTVLDCIYSQEKDTFYVLDAITYGNHDLQECEAQCRFFWLRSQFEQSEHLYERSAQNEKSFCHLAKFDFESSSDISMALQLYPLWPDNQPEIDGFLFYHKKSDYVYGRTPLVCWLFPFMVSDVLQLPVNSAYKPPVEYHNPFQYIEMFENKLNAKDVKKRKKNNVESVDMHVVEENESIVCHMEDTSKQITTDSEESM